MQTRTSVIIRDQRNAQKVWSIDAPNEYRIIRKQLIDAVFKVEKWERENRISETF